MRSTNDVRQGINVKLEIAAKEKNHTKKIIYFQEILQLFKLIPETNEADIRNIINCHAQIATAYFNLHQFEDAAKHYAEGIVVYASLKSPTDKDHRAYIIDNINRCDAFLEMNKIKYSHENTRQALHNFILGLKAFKNIQHINEKELLLGDVWANPNKFYYHYEKQTSSTRYLQSEKFKSFNQEEVLFNEVVGVGTNGLTELFNLLAFERSTAASVQYPVYSNPFAFHQPQPNTAAPIQENSMDIDKAQTYQPY